MADQFCPFRIISSSWILAIPTIERLSVIIRQSRIARTINELIYIPANRPRQADTLAQHPRHVSLQSRGAIQCYAADFVQAGEERLLMPSSSPLAAVMNCEGRRWSGGHRIAWSYLVVMFIAEPHALPNRSPTSCDSHTTRAKPVHSNGHLFATLTEAQSPLIGSKVTGSPK